MIARLKTAVLVATGAAFMGGGGAMAGAATPDITGWWRDDSGRAAILIQPCGAAFCGSIEWMKEPLDPATGKPKLDRQNPAAALRDKPLCGLKILWNFRSDGPGHWVDGKVYDPESGNVYSAEAAVEEANTLQLHGYIVLPLFGRTKVFTRTPEPAETCQPTP